MATQTYKIVNAKDTNYEDYEYAVCECTLATEGIEIPRPEHTEYIRLKCPRCGKKLGMVVRGKKDSYLGVL